MTPKCGDQCECVVLRGRMALFIVNTEDELEITYVRYFNLRISDWYKLEYSF